MNRIWAPWRIHYLKQSQKKGCIFCRIFKERADAENFVILRCRHSFAVLNTFPYTNGHTLIVPKKHIKSLKHLNQDEIIDMHQTLIVLQDVLQNILKPKGFNIGINFGRVSGAGIANHLHIHLVPRWPGDTNFMPVLADTRIISQSLRDLYQQVKKKVKKYEKI